MSGISLCDTCSNCECVFQSGVVREQCDFYKKRTGMIIDEIGYLMEALEEVNERDRIVKCNTIDRAIEVIDKEIQLAKDCQVSTVTLWRVRTDILSLKGEQE